ncbi:class I adenylate-forming enzyme family protein [Streptomyces ipomoeae]|uniref:class I adenylate-forming enzyme family protein n=1 Tax=Streptomyces ipomoeae TaxID=103232 RepID=UPI00114620A4|nr:AMP-binding protein [Streptomyces ipomoeae]MDX2937777.1 AMP-binding protein [Streptomyces ipomoeae]TQE17218.1 AMP-dependent synthetase [Streptomyces ipomoeae]
MNLGLAVSRSARRHPGRAAAFDIGREITWSRLDERSNRLAHVLLAHYGLGRGERVALWTANRVEVMEILSGVAKAGLVYVGLNFRMTDTELRHVFDNAQPRVLIVAAEFRERAQALFGRELKILELDGTGPADYEGLLSGASGDAPKTLHAVRPEDDFCIVYTSGTTGTPKGVWFDHAAALQHATVAALEYEIDHTARYLVTIPHNSSVHITIAPVMTMGGAVGFIDSRGFDPEKYAGHVARTATTHSFLVPTQLYRLLEADIPASALGRADTLGYGSSPMSPDKAGQLVERYGPKFIQLYGMSEIASIGTLLRKSDHAAAVAGRPQLLASAGQPSYATDVRVVDPTGADVAPGERGEVVFAGAHTMKGYYGDPERTGRTLIDGWVHSGDVGTWDAEGYLYIVDRIKDLIIRGGYNVAPAEVEAVVHRHPDVVEVGVIGLPDAEWGESVLAVVALRDGAHLAAEDIVDWCRADGSLTAVKVPERVEFVPALPKTAVGKIAKRELRERYGKGHGV